MAICRPRGWDSYCSVEGNSMEVTING
jgi:hypothetical protein